MRSDPVWISQHRIAWWLLLWLALLPNLLLVLGSEHDGTPTDSSNASTTTSDAIDVFDELDTGPEQAVLFPSFTITIGLIVFWLLTRYLSVLPYTAVMFLLGTLMGLGTVLNENWDDFLDQSLRQWVNINSRVLLLVFLPGLIYKDAFSQQVHIFSVALVQCLIFAFPMVLAGTALTALVGFYVFPYNWSFDFAMTFGAILSATDPVAVAALLEAVGAPPRLQVHIAGEALLNDGAAIVFFDIFAERYLAGLGVEGVGEAIGLKEGIFLFMRKALGAVAVGIFFGGGLLICLYFLNRRFDREENVVQVAATIGIAYLGFYVSEIVWETSGVLSTVVTGVMVKFFGSSMLNDKKLLDDFWALVEHLLNTVLFALGGAVWGAVIAKGEQDDSFHGKDWGYLVLLYVLLHVIRLFLFAVTYPVTSRIGLKTNWAETTFQVFGGLRGAVGIALAIFIDFEVREALHEDGGSVDTAVDGGEDFSAQTRKLFGFVGGIAFMTLTINGVLAGPLLRKMGLADSSSTREKIVRAYSARFQKKAVDTMVGLLTQPRFKEVNMALVKHHVPHLRNLTVAMLMEAVEKHKETTAPEDYNPPYLKRILPYLKETETDVDAVPNSFEQTEGEDKFEFDPEAHARRIKRTLRTKQRLKRRSLSSMRILMGEHVDPLSVLEMRSLFISVLRSAYEVQFRSGELDDREFLAITLESSLDFAEDAVTKGQALCDWKYLNIVNSPVKLSGKTLRVRRLIIRIVELFCGARVHTDWEYRDQRLKIEKSMAFMAAHRWAQQFVQKEFMDSGCELSEVGKRVLHESREQYKSAEAALLEVPKNELEGVVSHKFCLILLNSGIHYITRHKKSGLLRDQEAEHLIEEIEEEIQHVLSCKAEDHPGELTKAVENESFKHLMTNNP